MGNDDITLVSTTDTPEQVQAALTGTPAAEKPVTPEATPPPDKPAEPTPEPEKAAEPAAPETAEQKEDRETKEASEAGGRLSNRRQSIQQEIDDLTRNKYNVRRDVEAEEARLQELRRQREQFEPPAKPAAAKKDEPADGRTKPTLNDVDDKGDAKYATYEDYLDDHAKWGEEQAELAAKRVVEQERKADRERIERESANRAVNEHLAKYNTNLEEFKKTHADFDAVYEDARAEVRDALV